MEGKAMKSIYIHCPLLPEAEYRNILERLCPATVQNVTVYAYADGVQSKQLNALVDTQKNFSLQRPIRFRNILVLTHPPRLTKALRRALVKNNFILHLQTTLEQAPKLNNRIQILTKYDIHSKLWVDETVDQQEAYRCFRSLGLPLNLTRPCYTADTPDWFSQWLYDPTAQGINTFCDIITMLTLDTHSPNCRYASCFGTTFRVDAQQQVYLCPVHMDTRTCLGQLTDVDTLLQCDAVEKLLSTAIAKRQLCAETCHGFTSCQGGCPLEQDTDSQCAHYIATVDRIREALLDVYHNGKLDQVNNVVKNAILNALAFGTAFFN